MLRKRKRTQPRGPFEIEILDLSREGEGIARQPGGKAVFIADALPGERVRFLRIHSGRDVDRGSLTEVLQPSPQRMTPPCGYFGRCGGCSLQHLDPEAQVAFKEKGLLETLARIGDVRPERWLPALRGPSLNYRRRARLAARYDARLDRVVLGFRARDGRELLSLDACPILISEFSSRLAAMAELIHSLGIRDRVSQVELAAGDNAAAMVLRGSRAPDSGDQAKLAAFARATGIWVWLQPGGPDSLHALLPETPELCYRLPEHDCEIRFGPTDFIQANAQVNRLMVNQALALLDPKGNEAVLELFAGVGNFSLPLARRAKHVVTVEGDTAAVERARRNATLNALDNLEHHRGDLEAAPAARWLQRRYDAVLLDPPRTGAREVLPLVATGKPARVLYVSCHPGTLARDAGVLVHQFGYRLRAAGIMDMFPHTSHVESMALFENVA